MNTTDNTTSTVNFDKVSRLTTTLGNGNKFTITSLDREIEITNAVNQFRAKNGLSKTRNPFSWWKYALVAATYTDKAVTFNELRETLAKCNIHIGKTYSTLLSNAVRGYRPDAVRREYTGGLPWLAKHAGLKVGVVGGGLVGRPSFNYVYKNPEAARSFLIQSHPDLAHLFAQLDRHLA